jgi:hypothetical protein
MIEKNLRTRRCKGCGKVFTSLKRNPKICPRCWRRHKGLMVEFFPKSELDKCGIDLK